MIIIDTHIWIWWVHDQPELEPWMRQLLLNGESDGIGVSCISCWEIARLVAGSKLDLRRPIRDWISIAMNYPGVELIDLSPEICIDSNNLPGEFHKDPSDRIIVATARVLDGQLLTADRKILEYPNVKLCREPL